MCAARTVPTVKVAAKSGVRAQYRALRAVVPEIADTIAIFNEYKREIPPRALPRKMRDHALQGDLDGFRECHLAGDVLLIYTHENNVVTMIKICRHTDLYGKGAAAIKRAAKGK
jgi:addiction module RelE/StbE family toxin